MVMLRLIKLSLVLLLFSCASKQECTTISCQPVEKIKKSKKASFFANTTQKKRHKKPKQGLFKKGILPKMSKPN